MLLRFVAISILVFIALRLLGRVMATLFGPRPGPGAGEPRTRRESAPTERKSLPRQLEPCPHCGTYFDPERTATAAGNEERMFCSPGCLDAHALRDATGSSRAASPPDGSAS